MHYLTSHCLKLKWIAGGTNPLGWKASQLLTAEHPHWCLGCKDASASSAFPGSSKRKSGQSLFYIDNSCKEGQHFKGEKSTCVMLAYCCSQSFSASCRCCSHRVWMALIWSSLWVSSWRSSSKDKHAWRPSTPPPAVFWLRLLLVSSLPRRPSWSIRLSRWSSLAFSAFSSLMMRSVGLSFTTARFWIRFALKWRGVVMKWR